MRPTVVRLLVAALLFAGWLGYLVYLVRAFPRTPANSPFVLSRPQILVSELDVVGVVEGVDQPVKVVTVLYPDSEKGLEGQEIKVTNLDRCKPLPREGQKAEDVQPDFRGPGRYLLPLRKVGGGPDYEVTPTPPSPGYPPAGLRLGPPRIYPWDGMTEGQYRQVVKEKQ